MLVYKLVSLAISPLGPLYLKYTYIICTSYKLCPYKSSVFLMCVYFQKKKGFLFLTNIIKSNTKNGIGDFYNIWEEVFLR